MSTGKLCKSSAYRLAASASSHVEPVVVVLVEVVPVPVEILVGEAVLEAPVLEPLLGLPHVAHQHLIGHVDPLKLDAAIAVAVALLADVRMVLQEEDARDWKGTRQWEE